MTVETQSQPNTLSQSSLVERLRDVRVGVRGDLKVTRHVFRGDPSYAVLDPMTCQSHRLSPADYRILVAIEPGRSLGQIFGDLVDRGLITKDDEEPFYRFILRLHELSFLRLPVSDDKVLYQRYVARKRAQRRQKLLGLLFLRVPLVNPNAFLERTISYVQPLFTTPALVMWLCLVAVAGFVAACHAGQLIAPVEGVLAARNLPVMWLTLIVLKVLHELGHAYACKHYGGYVPEMGAYFIVFTPCAYVDATAMWGFPRTRHRLIVCLAGMYVESIAAAIALFVWALTPPGLIHDIAYTVIFLASIVTVLFNINPLMRYDGYYVLSDLVEIPNLRQRSMRYALALLKRVALGLPITNAPDGLRAKILMATFGVAASVYRLIIVIAISAMIATKVFLIGAGIAIAYVGSTLIGTVYKLAHYLWFSDETKAIRGRAVAISLVAMVAAPTLLLLVPFRTSVYATGMVAAEHESVVRASVDGFLADAHMVPGQRVNAGDLLADLTDDVRLEAIAEAQAHVEASAIRLSVFEVRDPTQAQQEKQRAAVHRKALEQRERELAGLTIRAGLTGTVVDCLDARDTGRRVHTGEPIATIVAGQWQVRAMMSEDQIADAQPKPGDLVEVRCVGRPGAVLQGVVASVAEAGSRTIEHASLTQMAGGSIAVNPMTGQASQPHFEVIVQLTNQSDNHVAHGMTARVRFPAHPQSLATAMTRGLMRFTNRLMQD